MNTTYQTYKDIEMTTEVLTASSHRLVQLLMEKCLQQMHMAKTHINGNEPSKKIQAITKARDIVDYLRSILNFDEKEARELSKLLAAIYTYMEKSLLSASLKNDVKSLSSAHEVLSVIKSGWDAIGEPK